MTEPTRDEIGQPGDPCKDCGQASTDGFWCQQCHEEARAFMDAMERERIRQGLPPCDWFERVAERMQDA